MWPGIIRHVTRPLVTILRWFSSTWITLGLKQNKKKTRKIPIKITNYKLSLFISTKEYNIVSPSSNNNTVCPYHQVYEGPFQCRALGIVLSPPPTPAFISPAPWATRGQGSRSHFTVVKITSLRHFTERTLAMQWTGSEPRSRSRENGYIWGVFHVSGWVTNPDKLTQRKW